MDPIPPDRSPRRGLWPEVLLALAVGWLPFLLLPHVYPAESAVSTLGDELLLLALEGIAIGLILFLVRRRDGSLRRVGLRRFRWPRELFWGFALYCASWTTAYCLEAILSSIGWKPELVATPEVAYPRTLIPFFLLASAFFEELLFRGFIQDRILRLTRRSALAIVLPSILFAAYHPYALRSLVDVAAFGMLFALFQHAGRMLPRLVIAHLGFNLAIYFEWWRV